MNKRQLSCTIACVSLLVAAGCGGTGTGPATGLDLARSEAAARNVPVLLDFYTDW